MDRVEFVKPKLKAGPATHGWVPILAVDEHGCVLHPEPVMTVPVGNWYPWVIPWLESLEVPREGEMVALTYHPALGETPPWIVFEKKEEEQ